MRIVSTTFRLLPLIPLLIHLPALAADWKPVPPEDLQLKTARVEPGAEAECLFWEVWLSNAFQNHEEPLTIFRHYLRIKIFSDSAVQKYGTVDLTYEGKERISDVSGRTIEPDGSIVELKKDAIFARVIEKHGRRKVNAVSFAMAGVKPGAIIEYQYKVIEDEIDRYVPLAAQREEPVEQVIYHVRPIPSSEIEYQMRYLPFNTKLTPFKAGQDGFSTATVGNLPAFHEEEDAPPSLELKSWVLIYYAPDRKETPDHFWKLEGKDRYRSYSSLVKVNGDVKQIADELTSGAKSDDEKLRKLYDYCQKHIKNINGPDATDADRQAFKQNHNTAETLKKGVGRGEDIELAFLALATAAGYDARMAYLSDRDNLLFHKESMISYLPVQDVAVEVGGKWRFYDPATPYLAAGKVRWQEEGVSALIADSKDPEIVEVPVTKAEESNRKQSGQLKLDEEGSLEGTLQEVLTGHPADEWRQANWKHSPQERERMLIDDVKNQFPGAEVSAVKMTDPADVSSPVSIEYHVKVETFATRTGKRMFFTPALFQLNEPARYTSSTRKYDLLFNYPWSEEENVSIELPSGFMLDHADVPAPIKFDPVGGYQVNVLALSNRILYHRAFTFGKDGTIYIPIRGYPVLKKIFDGVHDNDAHLLTLKQRPTVAENKQ